MRSNPSIERTLFTSHCALEPLLKAHAAEMFTVLADPAIYEFENAPPESLQALEARYERLEARAPATRNEQWLNWVVRIPTGQLAGYVQATVLPDRTALIAYELNSAHWRQGIGSAAVSAIATELASHYSVQTLVAVLKASNYRSAALLRKLGFRPADEATTAKHRDEPGELVMFKPASDPANAA
jgi:[ribosomal protein S5]-alanine N-acetyltransferase